jgi:hypothetical protein
MDQSWNSSQWVSCHNNADNSSDDDSGAGKLPQLDGLVDGKSNCISRDFSAENMRLKFCKFCS